MQLASFKYMKCHNLRAIHSEFLDGDEFGRVRSRCSIESVTESESLKRSIAIGHITEGEASKTSTNHESGESSLSERSWDEVLGVEGETIKAQVGEETLGSSENH